MSTYKPKIVDTSSIKLPEQLMLLAEQMAENVHEIWAATRIEQGWIYGPSATTASSTTLAWCLTANCPKRRRSTTATPASRR